MFFFSHSNIATLDNLQPFTLYNISVSAHSDEIQGPYSHPILVQTKEDGELSLFVWNGDCVYCCVQMLLICMVKAYKLV